ncbi:MAG: metallophosphoesterase family protein [Chloroflexi bacterium]|nr:metallophosphoesterase family protein [Chloroflexota bacterium]
MPRWGLVSDVHGNLARLEEALATLRQRGATHLAFLGDYLGKGNPDACVRLIRGVADAAVVGNRDLDWQDRVALESKAWVLSLPRLVQAGPLLLTHGDARLSSGLDTGQVRRGFTRAWERMANLDARVWAFGHSHHARTWSKAARDSEPVAIPGPRAALQTGARYMLNVGTTGLPFPGKGGPSVAVVDLDEGWAEHVSLAVHSADRA